MIVNPVVAKKAEENMRHSHTLVDNNLTISEDSVSFSIPNWFGPLHMVSFILVAYGGYNAGLKNASRSFHISGSLRDSDNPDGLFDIYCSRSHVGDSVTKPLITPNLTMEVINNNLVVTMTEEGAFSEYLEFADYDNKVAHLWYVYERDDA